MKEELGVALYLDLCSILILLSLPVWQSHVPKFCWSTRQKHPEVAFSFPFCGSLRLVPLLSPRMLLAWCWQAHYWEGFPGGAVVKNPSAQCRKYRRHGFSPWVKKIPWSRKWQPTPVFLSGKSHGQRSLAGYSPWGHKKLDAAEHTYYWPCHSHIFSPTRSSSLKKPPSGPMLQYLTTWYSISSGRETPHSTASMSLWPPIRAVDIQLIPSALLSTQLAMLCSAMGKKKYTDSENAWWARLCPGCSVLSAADTMPWPQTLVGEGHLEGPTTAWVLTSLWMSGHHYYMFSLIQEVIGSPPGCVWQNEHSPDLSFACASCLWCAKPAHGRAWDSLPLETRWISCCLSRDFKSILRPIRTASQFESTEVPRLVTAKHKSVVSQDLYWLLLSASSKRLPGKKFFWGFWECAEDS